MKVGIAGGGLVGRLLAWRLAVAGAKVEIFDADARRRCAPAAAGMLGPWIELAETSQEVCAQGRRSIGLWQSWLEELDAVDLLVRNGSLLLAHPRDYAELERRVETIRAKTENSADEIVELDAAKLHVLEPDLGNYEMAYFFPGEANVMVDAVLERICEAALDAGVKWHGDVNVDEVSRGLLSVEGTCHEFDWACDCRGVGGSAAGLRPVRGETLHLVSDTVSFRRPLHFAHPRQQLYIAPCDNRLILGATSIESSDTGRITVRSALELLGAAYTFIPELAEATIVDTRSGLRPTLPDNEPCLEVHASHLSINGMYRHGYLTSPAFVADAIESIGLA